MSPRAFPTATTLAMLTAAPARIAELMAVPDDRRRIRPRADAWSAHEIFAHVRACADVWGGHITAILGEHPARIPAGDPRAWAVEQGYFDAPFDASFVTYTADRERLLALLRELTNEGWASAALMVGSASLVERCVHWHADHIARHEEQHIVEIRRALRASAR